MLKGFRQFILRGNVVDLAVAVVMGAAFGAVISSLVINIVTPLIAAIAGKPDFSAFTATLNGGVIQYGLFLNALIAFIMVALAVYFFIVVSINVLAEWLKCGGAPADKIPRQCS